MRNFDEAPFLVIWELTQACDLACVHCRACAIDSRNPFELTSEEGFRLLEEVRALSVTRSWFFTGGDLLKRPDLFPLLEKSVSLGLRTTVTPSATLCSQMKPSSNSRAMEWLAFPSVWTEQTRKATTAFAGWKDPSTGRSRPYGTRRKSDCKRRSTPPSPGTTWAVWMR